MRKETWRRTRLKKKKKDVYPCGACDYNRSKGLSFSACPQLSGWCRRCGVDRALVLVETRSFGQLLALVLSAWHWDRRHIVSEGSEAALC